MKTKDRLFIFLAAVLIILFAVEIFLNLSRPNLDDFLRLNLVHQADRTKQDTDKILIRLEQAGLEPKEAEYYMVYDE